MRILGAWIDAAVVAVWTLVHRLERMQSTWSGRVERERRMTLEVTECLLRGGDNCTRALYGRIETCALSLGGHVSRQENVRNRLRTVITGSREMEISGKA